MRKFAVAVASLGILLAGRVGLTQRPASTPGMEWPMYRHDYAGTGYSPLAQITTKNVATLREVWTYNLQSDARVPAAPARGGGALTSQATPIVVNGTMYLPAANRVVALDPQTGKERWQHIVSDAAPSRRGVAYWERVAWLLWNAYSALMAASESR